MWEIGALQSKEYHKQPSGGQRQDTLLTSAHQSWLDLDKDGGCFAYLCHAFPGLAMEKLKSGILDDPQLRQLIRDSEFENSMNEVELEP